jgi:hypothetical protein
VRDLAPDLFRAARLAQPHHQAFYVYETLGSAVFVIYLRKVFLAALTASRTALKSSVTKSTKRFLPRKKGEGFSLNIFF